MVDKNKNFVEWKPVSKMLDIEIKKVNIFTKIQKYITLRYKSLVENPLFNTPYTSSEVFQFYKRNPNFFPAKVLLISRENEYTIATLKTAKEPAGQHHFFFEENVNDDKAVRNDSLKFIDVTSIVFLDKSLK